MPKNMINKKVSIDKAISYIKDNTVLMYGGFGGVGTSPLLINEIVEKKVSNLTLIGNDAGFPTIGIGRVVSNGQAKKNDYYAYWIKSYCRPINE
jgi:acetate CoA/acetoacetate CoA-transferase alpha subunit